MIQDLDQKILTGIGPGKERLALAEKKTNYEIRFYEIWGSFFSRVLRDSTPRFVGPSVGPSITLYFFGVFAVFGLMAPAQMIK